jgi:hypothetical protein
MIVPDVPHCPVRPCGQSVRVVHEPLERRQIARSTSRLHRSSDRSNQTSDPVSGAREGKDSEQDSVVIDNGNWERLLALLEMTGNCFVCESPAVRLIDHAYDPAGSSQGQPWHPKGHYSRCTRFDGAAEGKSLTPGT